MSKTLTWQPVAPPAAWRRRLARTLRVTGRALAAWARRLVPPEPAPRPEPVLEFYAEAGAPEGALFIDVGAGLNLSSSCRSERACSC